MFPRSLRLSRAGFDQSRRLPRKATTHFSISHGQVQNASGIGIIVPKKIAKSSVVRHQLKRRVREVVRDILRHSPNTDTVLVITARAGASTLPFHELKNELSAAFEDILVDNTANHS